MLNSLLVALQFLTRLPVPAPQEMESADIGRSLPAYPWVGLIIGVLLAILGALLSGLPVPVRAALLLAAWVVTTGALHLDGLADSADAWLGGHGERERTLEIMKDPYSGPAAVVVLVLVLLVKFAALQALLTAGHWQGLLIAPLLGRTALPLLFLTTEYVREGGLGSALAAHLDRTTCQYSLTLAVILALAFGGFWSIVLAGATFYGLRELMLRRLGGTTGDTAGALVEIVEAVALIGLAL